MALLTDLYSLKTMLDLPMCNTEEDAKLLLYMRVATDWIEEVLNRKGVLFYQDNRTEIYSGTGTAVITLRARPVYATPTIQCWVDANAYWGSDPNAWTNQGDQLTYGTDFALKVDQPDGTSRSGVLTRLRAYWPKSWARSNYWLTPFVAPDTGSVKVVYSGGYTIDAMPANLRMACVTLIAKMRYLMPVGMALSSESYEDRSIQIIGDRKEYLLSTVKDMLSTYRTWSW